MDSIQIRQYQTGDAVKIYSLFAKHTPYQRDAAFWIWINRLLADKQSIITVAAAGDEIIGHYALIPRTCCLDNNENFNCCLGIHAFVAPEYREQVSIFSVSALAYQTAKEKGADFVYGFPNVNYRLIQEKIERWKKVQLFNAWVKKATGPAAGSLHFNWRLLTDISYEEIFTINTLLETSFTKARLRFNKPLNYFLNRYIHHPQKPYQCWMLEKDGGIKGIVVTKIFSAETTRLHIIDCIFTDESGLQYLADDIEVKFSNAYDEAVMWPVSTSFVNLLAAKGYEQTGFDTFFAIKLLSEKAEANKDLLLNFENWELPMGDSDAF